MSPTPLRVSRKAVRRFLLDTLDLAGPPPHYTMPILAGDRLIGRMDPQLDRERGRLIVRLLHLEPGVRPTAALRRPRRALEAYAAFHGAEGVKL